MEEKWQARLRDMVALEFSENRVRTADEMIRELLNDKEIEQPPSYRRCRDMIALYRNRERNRESLADIKAIYSKGVADGTLVAISRIEDLVLPHLTTDESKAAAHRCIEAIRGTGPLVQRLGRLLTPPEIEQLTALGYGVGWDDDDEDKTQFNHIVKTRDVDPADYVPLCGSKRLWFVGEPFWSSRGDGSWVDEDRRLGCADCLALLPALLVETR